MLQSITSAELYDAFKVVLTMFSAVGIVWSFAVGYQRVVAWADSIKNNHLHTIEENTSRLLEKTEAQTEVLIEIRTILAERK